MKNPPINHFTTNRHKNPIMNHLHRNLLLLLTMLAIPLGAATSVNVTVTLTIDHEVAIVWCDASGNNDTTTETWAVGTVGLDTTYVSTSQGTGPTYRYIQNTSRTGLSQDVDIAVGTSTDGWTCGAARGSDTFTMEVASDGSTWSHLNASQDDYVADLAADGVTAADYEFRIGTPNALTAGIGAEQSIVITFTAEDGTGD